MSCTGSFPRKWSIRKRRSSGKIAVRRWFSSRADARSVPNGFSTTSRAARRPSPPPRAPPPPPEHRRRRREVEDGGLGSVERNTQPVVQRLVLGIASDVRHARQDLVQHLVVELVLLGGGDGLGRMPDELSSRERTAADADDRAGEDALLREVVERRQRAPPARSPVMPKTTSVCRVHHAESVRATKRSMSTPSARSSTGMRSFAEWTSFVASSVSIVFSGKNP